MMSSAGLLAAVVAGIASRQHGVASRSQLLAAGMSPATITLWIRTGHLHRIHRGVYALGHRAISGDGIRLAAVLARRDGSVLSHGSAAQLWGLIRGSERMALG